MHASPCVFSRPLDEQKVFSIGQEVGIAIGEFFVVIVRRSRILGSTTAIGYPLQRTGNIRREQDRTLFVPGASASFGRVAQRLHRAASGRDFSQLAIGEKSEVLSVGRPEGE